MSRYVNITNPAYPAIIPSLSFIYKPNFILPNYSNLLSLQMIYNPTYLAYKSVSLLLPVLYGIIISKIRQFPPEPAYIYCERIVIYKLVIVPHVRHDLIPRHYLFPVGKQQLEYDHLILGENHLLITFADCPLAEVDLRISV